MPVIETGWVDRGQLQGAAVWPQRGLGLYPDLPGLLDWGSDIVKSTQIVYSALTCWLQHVVLLLTGYKCV